MGKYFISLIIISLITSSISKELKFLSDSPAELNSLKQDENPCFKLISKNNSLYVIKTTSGQWWSTSALTFYFQNTCNQPQLIKNSLIVTIDQWRINNNLVTAVSDYQQDGSSPWLSITGGVQGDKISINISLPCDKDCDWAKIPQGLTREITVTASLGAAIINSLITDIYMSPPVPVIPGVLDVDVDSKQLILLCPSTCSITVNLVNSATKTVTKSFSFDPLTMINNSHNTISDIPPTKYYLEVVKSTLPDPMGGKITFNFIPNESVSITSNQTSNVKIVFEFTPASSMGKITFVLGNIPSDFSGKFDATVSNKESSESYKISFTKLSNSVTLTDLPANSIYDLNIQGLGYPSKGVYYSPINLKTLKVVGNSNIKMDIPFLQMTSGLHGVTINCLHYTDSQLVKISFSGTNFVYVENNLNTSNLEVYKFPTAEDVKLSVESPAGWQINLSPEVVKSTDSQVSVDFSKQSNNFMIGGYYQSWSANWASSGKDLSITKIPSYISRILVAFANPSMNYIKGQNDLANTGIQFSSSFEIVKQAIAIAHSEKPNQKFILSVGGATYPWTNPNFSAMVDLMNDLGLDGIDIDFEDTPSCTGTDTLNLSCTTDNRLIEIITNLRRVLPAGKLLTAAVFSVGAYGTTSFPMSKYLPGSGYTGMWVNPLIKAGDKLDEIFVMSYDASPAYKPTDGFNAYKSIYKNKIHLGLEVPPEAWGGYVLTVDDSLKYANHVKSNNGSGMFIWSLEKAGGGSNAYTFLGPICKLYGYSNCDQQIPLN